MSESVEIISDSEMVTEETAGAESTSGEEPSASAPKRPRGSRYSGGKSAVWDHFDYDSNDKKTKCRHCSFITSDKNPSNLQKHLKQHPAALTDVEKKTEEKRSAAASSGSRKSKKLLVRIKKLSKPVARPALSQPTITSLLSSKKPYEKGSAKQKQLMESLSILFASHSLPHLLVESPEFCNFTKSLDPRFELPNRKRLSAEIKTLHATVRTRILAELEKVEKVSIILDIWSEKGLSESFMGITAKYIKPGTSDVVSALLALKKMSRSHTGQNVFETLQAELSLWKIFEDKILYYVTDNGSNMVKALKECVIEYAPLTGRIKINGEDKDDIEQFEEGDINLDASFVENEIDSDLNDFDRRELEYTKAFTAYKRLPCVAHQLSCAVRKCVDKSKMLQPIIVAAFKLVKAISKSTLNNELLLKYNGHRLLSPSQTRWIYTFYVLDRLLESKDAVEKVVSENDLIDVALDALKWKQMGHVRDILKPFAAAVNDLEGDQYATLSQVIPAIIDLVETMNKRAGSSLGFGAVASDLKRELESRFSVMLNPASPGFQPAYLLASFFDPRYVVGLTQEQRKVSIEMIIRMLSGDRDNSGHSTNISLAPSTSEDIAQSRYSGFFKRAQLQRSITPRTTDDRIREWRSKLEAYAQECTESVTSLENEKRINPIDYWFVRGDSYKDISSFAMHLLAVPASSTGTERAFSAASIVQGGRRYRLNAENMQNDLMIKMNKGFLTEMTT